MKPIVRRCLGVLVAVLAVVTLWVVVSLSIDRPVTYDEITDHFKYGSIGSEPGVSLLQPVGGVLPPYSVFSALPSICPEKLPGGYASLGYVKQMRDPPSLFERTLIRFGGLVDRVKLQTLALRNRIAPILEDRVPKWGRGRVDTFNPYKAIQFNWRLDRLPSDEIVGASD